jgi:hypothetical protein
LSIATAASADHHFGTTRQGERIYSGQIVTDAGGNQLMLDNGPVTCKVKG